MAQWEVTGGVDTGGILVREGQGLNSPKAPEGRLATGAVVEELELVGDRLHYRLVTGTGPQEGWVSTSVSGKRLLEPRATPAAEAKAEAEPAPAAEPPAVEEAAAVEPVGSGPRPAENSYAEWAERYFEALGRGEVTGRAPGPPAAEEGGRRDADFEAIRKAAQAYHDKPKETETKPLPPWIQLSSVDVKKVANETLNGDMYGLPVPPTLAKLEKRGAPWFTQAFRKSGIISKDNAVAEIVSFYRLPVQGKDSAGGAGPKAFIKVKWKIDSKDLHKELFVKMPWACDGSTKEEGCDPYYRWKCSCTADYEAQEARIYRFLGPIFPFKIPKYYFADICRQNTNYVLITEKVQFGKKGKTDLKPYEILPCASKLLDFELEPRQRHEMYYCLLRAQARMAAWDKNGFFDIIDPQIRGLEMGPPPLGSFEWPIRRDEKTQKLKAGTAEKTVARYKEWLEDHGKNLYPKKYLEPKFLEAFYDMLMDVTPFLDALGLYNSLFPEMIAMQHPNLQADNGFFWRNSSGEMDCGLIDWGGASPKHLVSVMNGCLSGCEGAVLDEHEDGFLQCFIDEYYQECGIKLDFSEVRRQWWLAYASSMAYQATQIEMEIYREVPREQWAGVTSIEDPRFMGKWVVRCTGLMIAKALEYLHIRWVRNGQKHLHVHDTFLEWKEFWEQKGMC